MKISEVKSKMRVQLSPKVAEEWKVAIANGWRSPTGTLTSGRILSTRPPYEEGLFVRVKWDGMPAPENWHLVDLCPSDSAKEKP